jgi:DNA invertase Pin-like site-specific DNA recombinase
LVKEGLARAREQGVHVGGLPYGQRYGERVDSRGRRVILPHPAELALLALLEQLNAQGLSAVAIAAALNARGATTRRETTWTARSIRRLLKQLPDLEV